MITCYVCHNNTETVYRFYNKDRDQDLHICYECVEYNNIEWKSNTGMLCSLCGVVNCRNWSTTVFNGKKGQCYYAVKDANLSLAIFKYLICVSCWQEYFGIEI